MAVSLRDFLVWLAIFFILGQGAQAAVVNATWNSAADVPVTVSSYVATGDTVVMTLSHAPAAGASLTVVNNTGLAFISGAFSNLAHGQKVSLAYNGVSYPFVANYFGGTGNDLVLMWADTRLVAWGGNEYGALGNNTTTSSNVPVPVTSAFTPLEGRTALKLSSGGDFSVAVCDDGTLASWGFNSSGQLGCGSQITRSLLPVPVVRAGTPLDGRTVAAMDSGSGFTVAVCSDGTLVAWGESWAGQLGRYLANTSYVPLEVPVAGTPLEGKTVVAVSAGSGHCLALTTEGRLYGWGRNDYDQLNDGSVINRTNPVEVRTHNTPLEGRTVVAMSAGGLHSIALCSDGTLGTWGWDGFGQLGSDSAANTIVPVHTAGGPLEGRTVVEVQAGGDHCLVLCSDGTLASWGYNAQGQLGNGSTTNRNRPGPVDTSGALAGKTVVALTGPSSVRCSDGTLVAWGENSTVPVVVNLASYGSAARAAQAATTTCSPALIATPQPVLTTLAATAVGTTTVVLNGIVNANGGVTTPLFEHGVDGSGIYDKVVAGVPGSATGTGPTVISTTVTGLAANTTYRFRLIGTTGAMNAATHRGAELTFTTLNGNLSSLGLSAGTLAPAFSPAVYSYRAAVGSAVGSVAVTPFISDVQATATVNGTPVASGSASGQIPLAYGDNKIQVVITAADGSSSVAYTFVVARSVPAAWTAAYATGADIPLTSDGFSPGGGTVSFSLNHAPQPGAVLTVVNNTGPEFISGTFSNLAHGQSVNLAYNGGIYPFVASYYGGTGNDLVLIWAGSRLVSWGYNYHGELGNGTTTSSNVPVAVTTSGAPMAGRKVLSLSAGYETSMAVLSDGSLSVWGYNVFGQLGNNSTNDSNLPVAVPMTGTPLAGKVVVAAAAGYLHNLVLCADGSMAAWGLNSAGQLGSAPPINNAMSSVPLAVPTAGTPLAGRSVVAIGAGQSHSVALCSDGTVVTWGSDFDEQLGRTTTPASWSTYVNAAPAAVTTTGTALAGKRVVSIGAGRNHTVALCSDGTLVTWGQNTYRQLGTGDDQNRNVPTAVVTTGTALAGKTVTAVAAGAVHNVVLCSDGTLITWGGGGSSTPAPPVIVPTVGTVLAGKTVVGLTAGQDFSLVRCSDGTVGGWGNGSLGNLGNGSTNRYATPVAPSSSGFEAGECFLQVGTGQGAWHSLALVATPAPSVGALPASAVTTTSAVLNGMVNANGAATTVSFDYGLDTTYGTTVAAVPASLTGGSSTAVSFSLAGLQQGRIYHYRIRATSSSGMASSADQTISTANTVANWRLTHFNTTANSGLAADTADDDHDGIPNLLEYAMNLPPRTAGVLPVAATRNGASFEYVYTRSVSAVNAGTTYTVEQSASLSAPSWTSAGVVQTVVGDDGITQQVKAVIPMGAAARSFVRLSVSGPPQ